MSSGSVGVDEARLARPAVGVDLPNLPEFCGRVSSALSCTRCTLAAHSPRFYSSLSPSGAVFGDHAFERQPDRRLPGRILWAAGETRECQRPNFGGPEANFHRRAQRAGRDAAAARPAARLELVPRAGRQVGRHGGRLASGRLGRECVLDQGARGLLFVLPRNARFSFRRDVSLELPARVAPPQKIEQRADHRARSAASNTRPRPRATQSESSPPSRLPAPSAIILNAEQWKPPSW